MSGRASASKASADNRANQMNPNNQAYGSSRGGGAIPSADAGQAATDNRANQLNPNNDAYAKSRGGQWAIKNQKQRANMLKEVGFWCEVHALRHSASITAATSERSPLLPSLKHAASLAVHAPQEEEARPDPTLLVDHAWYLTNSHFVKMLEWYLLEGACVESHELAYSFCRFRKCTEAAKNPKCMGACTLTDGVYIWPEGYVHYVRVHHVRPPQDFLDHVATNYRRALLATKALSREFGLDTLFLWDVDRKRPVPMPSGMQHWILMNTTVQLPGQRQTQTPDERKLWERLCVSRMPTNCCQACTIS